MFDPSLIKNDFPIFNRTVNGKPLVYLDSGATSQKPKIVLDAEREYYEKHNANVHRGAHTLGDEATTLLSDSRSVVAGFVGAMRTDEIIFVRNATEAINLVSYGWGLDNLVEGDVIVTSEMEHHANLVPWQQITKRTGAKLELVKVKSDGTIDLADYKQKLKLRPKLVAMVHVSNATGTINPVKEITKMAHKVGALILIDGAQAVPHMKVDVSDIGCDFYVFSGHKMLGPMGIGVLWGKSKILTQMSPFLTGGGMINEVYSDYSSWAALPEKFEAGTPNVAGAVGMMSACQYLDKLDQQKVRAHDRMMVEYCICKLQDIPQVKIIGPLDPDIRSGSVSFEYSGVHAHDVATIVDSYGVAVRSGHHCTMVLHNKLGINASVRASFNVYTTKEDIDQLIFALSGVEKVFGGRS